MAWDVGTCKGCFYQQEIYSFYTNGSSSTLTCPICNGTEISIIESNPKPEKDRTYYDRENFDSD